MDNPNTTILVIVKKIKNLMVSIDFGQILHQIALVRVKYLYAILGS